MDPNQENERSGWRKAEQWPDDILPSGVEKDDSKFYAYERIYNDGRREWVFYRRGKPLPEGQMPEDRPFATVPDRPVVAVREAYEKEKEKAEKGRLPIGTPRQINNVPHVVTGYDEQGVPVWAPAQTAQGPAQPTPPRQRRTRTDIEGTPTGRQNPDGTPEYDNERPRAIVRDLETGEVLSDAPLTGGALDEWRADRERSRNPGRKTDKELADERKEREAPPTARESSRRMVKGKNGQQYLEVISFTPEGQPSGFKYYDPASGKEIPAPDLSDDDAAKGTVVTRNGQNYTVRPGKGPQGAPTIEVYDATGRRLPSLPAEQKEYAPSRNPETGETEQVVIGPDGKPVIRVIPREGQQQRPATRAPSLPRIVVGAAQDALRQAYDEIQSEVDSGRRTAAWGENRRKEVFEAAELTVREAQLHEQSRQYNQSTAYNLATFKANYGQNALENAMRFTLQILGEMEPGSGTAGNFFRAMFGLQMQMLRDSGIYGIAPGGGRSSVGDPATRPPIAVPKPSVNDPASSQAAAAATRANIEAGLLLPPRPEVPESQYPQQRVPSAAEVEAERQRVTAGFGQAIAPLVNPAAPESVAPTAPPSAVPPPPPTEGAQAPGPGPKLRVRDRWGNESELTQQQIDNIPGGAKDLTVLGPVSTAAPSPEPEFAALAGLAPPARPMEAPTTPASASWVPAAPEPATMPEMPDALLRAQVAATPPWRLPEDQLDSLVERFGPETVFSVPRMRDLVEA